jgi:hypothetical protein
MNSVTLLDLATKIMNSGEHATTFRNKHNVYPFEEHLHTFLNWIQGHITCEALINSVIRCVGYINILNKEF